MSRIAGLSLALFVATTGCAAASKAPVTARLAVASPPHEIERAAPDPDASASEEDPAASDDQKPAPVSTPEPDPRVAREKALEEAQEVGMIALLSADPNDPTIASLLGPGGTSNGQLQGTIGGLSGVGTPGAVGVGTIGKSGLRLSSQRSHGRDSFVRGAAPPPPPAKPPAAPTRLRLVSVTATGLSVDAVSGAFDRADRVIRACYETALERDPAFETTLTIELGIDKDGRPTQSHAVHGAPDDAALDKCVQKAAGEMSFAHPATEATVKLEVTLRRPPRPQLE